ncbi:cyclic peptide export ABC transporter [Xenorhabdus bovienii]|uniref:Cyclic peptide export ABC transporter n=1 Tax=Xenorhabdus bovienii TaxID=40576 RepID=A0AAJ1J7K6_XENBV|nr:cyclic peptide export ABC transporter [Xenorhabdus bovienii]MDE1476893.1 cyclic peptide export ABC transporter [Xenorhabdus bovienii]MDE1485092.1 cyclic peptide export ABC transporter [Xenorhabdus bovienii]MDE1494187.1 cyclic peptide export ABC transporter [Xenorhabdus bovienii]MDE9430280.1 cyclic peptide export ABC transporter [Xenorhabdus bovienii]MDE9444917.1 cyclic peptide export ABC transporter [Xenorhabdus bovienii]
MKKPHFLLLSYLGRVSPSTLVMAIAISILAGFFYTLLIPTIIYSIGDNTLFFDSQSIAIYRFFNSPIDKLAILFVILCGCVWLTKFISLAVVDVLARKSSVVLKLDLYQKIRNMPIEQMEDIGPSRFITILNKDIPQVSSAMAMIPLCLVSLITVTGVLGYIFYLETRVFYMVLLWLFIGVIGYQVPQWIAMKFLSRARQTHDTIQEGIRGLLYGAKELKLNKIKSDEFFAEELQRNEKIALKNENRGNVLMMSSFTFGDIIPFLVIGIITFHFSFLYHLSTSDLYGIIVALMYLSVPMGFILESAGRINMSRVAARKVIEIRDQLQQEPESTIKQLNDWDTITLKNVSYKYKKENESTFKLSPINLTFEREKISFIVGGNGSGKSTLGKIISQHYIPNQGKIYFGDQLINDKNRDAARAKVSAIYSDFYTFKKLYGQLSKKEPELVQDYLNYLRLDKVVHINENVINNIKLSDGQKRRLALLSALLEDRDIYVFDEWAADQDPVFKQFFYQEILPWLKEKKKIVITITHDERYFSYADTIIMMEDGKVINYEDI